MNRFHVSVTSKNDNYMTKTLQAIFFKIQKNMDKILQIC